MCQEWGTPRGPSPECRSDKSPWEFVYLAPGLAGPRPWPPEKVAGDDRKSQDKSQARCPGKGLRVTVPAVLCGGGRPSRGTHAQLGPSPTPPSRKPQPTEIIPKRGRPASLTPSLALSSLSGRHCLCQAPGLPWAPSCPENTSRMTAGSAVWNHFEDEDSYKLGRKPANKPHLFCCTPSTPCFLVRSSSPFYPSVGG